MKERRIVSSLAAVVLLVSHSALAQVAPETSGISYNSRLKAPRMSVGPKLASEPPLEVRLTARFTTARELVRSLVRIAPHPDNRSLRVTVDSLGYYSSSDVQLDGASAAKSHFFTWKSLPPGAYEVTATVFGPDGPRRQRTASFEVIGGMGVSP